MKKISSILLFLVSVLTSTAQLNEIGNQKPKSNRFIDKVEVFAGPNLSFNHGNKFIENYKDENVKNKRDLKTGYTVGFGLYHKVSPKIDFNFRLQYERKGTKSEFNAPDIINNYRVKINSEYDYDYFTLAVVPRFFIDRKGRIAIGVGGYYNRLNKIKGCDTQYTERDNVTTEGCFEGRLSRDLTEDGIIYAFNLQSGLTGMEKNDFGIVLSTTYIVYLKNHNELSIQLIDNLGLSNINKNNSYNLKEKNHSISLLIGYTLLRPFKKIKA